MRLIDADELKIDYGFSWDDIAPTHEEMIAVIDRQPTIDAVPVVRCKDCKRYTAEQNLKYCELYGVMVLPSEDDFCSMGKRGTE